jgi:hypothetical protein
MIPIKRRLFLKKKLEKEGKAAQKKMNADYKKQVAASAQLDAKAWMAKGLKLSEVKEAEKILNTKGTIAFRSYLLRKRIRFG